MKDRKPWPFCETPEEECTMNYCDTNGCVNRKREYVDLHDILSLNNSKETLSDEERETLSFLSRILEKTKK